MLSPNPPNADGAYPAYYHVAYAYSDDSGATWTENMLTPTAPSNEPWVTPLVGPFWGQNVGHYLGLAVAGNKAIPCYTSLQNGTTEKQESDIFVNVVTH